jgi:2-hydroxychromene-2-carboxylate isomerase
MENRTGKTVEFWFDFGSPASYLAWFQLPKTAASRGAAIDWRPMLLGGVFQATSNRSPVEVPSKGKWMHGDLPRWAERYGAPYKRNPHFPINTLTLMRGAVGLQMKNDPRFPKYVETVYRAIWEDEKNMNDPNVVGTVLKEAGFDPAEFMAMVGDPGVKDKLKAVTQEAVERGVFGAPTMFVDGQQHFGQDRIDFVADRLADNADEATAACMETLDRFMAALNASDAAAMDAVMHFPHIRIAGGRVTVYEKPGSNPMDLFDKLRREDNWARSAWNERKVVQRSASKLHMALTYTRYRADGSTLGVYESLYVLTLKEGRWGIQARSSFGP